MLELNNNLLSKNILYILKERGIKIGDFEKSMGVSLGYLSRIAKDEAASPNLNFLIKTANSLGISIETLLGSDLSELSGQEIYFKTFLDKLIADTKASRISWEEESASYLNNLTCNKNGQPEHVLFSKAPSDDIDRYGLSSQSPAAHAIFKSKQYGVQTIVNNTCYSFDYDDERSLYLMAINKAGNRLTPGLLEMWLYEYHNGISFIGSEASFPRIKESFQELYREIATYMEHPNLPWNIRSFIDDYLTPPPAPNTSGVITDNDIPF